MIGKNPKLEIPFVFFPCSALTATLLQEALAG